MDNASGIMLFIFTNFWASCNDQKQWNQRNENSITVVFLNYKYLYAIDLGPRLMVAIK